MHVSTLHTFLALHILIWVEGILDSIHIQRNARFGSTRVCKHASMKPITCLRQVNRVAPICIPVVFEQTTRCAALLPAAIARQG